MKRKILISILWLLLVSLSTAHAQSPQQVAAPKTPERVKVSVPAFAAGRLNELGFVAVPQNYQTELGAFYRSYQRMHWPAVVTSDAALHASHLVFDWYQRYLEIAYLRSDLIALTDALLSQMMEDAESAEGPMKDAALADAAFFTVGKRLLTGGDTRGIPEPWKGKIDAELALIRQAGGIAQSPLFNYKEDYSQYKPRGHYSRTPQFQQYFQAMMWYGRIVFRLKSSEDAELAKRQTRQALLICRALQQAKAQGEEALTVWRRIYATTEMFAGHSDDPTPEDYLKIMGRNKSPKDWNDNYVLEAFMVAVSDLGWKQLLPFFARASKDEREMESMLGMRLFGTRWAIDSLIMRQLTFNAVGNYSGEKPDPFTLVRVQGMKIRGFPRGLDVMSAFSMPQAETWLRAGQDDRYDGYAESINKMRNWPADGEPWWRDNLYTIRLKAIRRLARAPQGTLPAAIKTVQWQHKQLTAALGSWTELRHDSILYTKQSYAMAQAAFAGMTKGGGPEPPPPPPPQGYVEPVPEVYQALGEGFKLLADKLSALGYAEDKALRGIPDRYQGLMVTLERLSRKELTGTALTAEEFRFIENIGGELSIPRYGLPHHRDVTEEFMGDDENDMRIVADVHTNVDVGLALEEAVGRPMELYMVCPVNGNPVVCIGVVYSYYEFKQPIGNRLTDEEWRKMLEQGREPGMAEWIATYSARR